jgi:16S rRNA (cytidine1402-2'-O)-methyltransferase
MPRQAGAGGRGAGKRGGTGTASVGPRESGGEPNHGADGSKRPTPGLYIVATPIGNTEDITLRALRILRGADVVACEDTRVTAKLFARHGIASTLLAYHDHNAERMRPLLLERLRQGQVVALVSDAGTPLVSDPGFKLVRAAVAEGLPVTTLPGASAPLAALVLSGLPSDRFLFGGFLPARGQARRRALEELAGVPATLIFFETAPRLAASLHDMKEMLGDRPAAMARELTKLYEEVRRGALSELAAHYAAAGAPKGEVVVFVAPPASEPGPPAADVLDAQLRAALDAMSIRDASVAVAAATGLPRRDVYARALALRGEGK